MFRRTTTLTIIVVTVGDRVDNAGKAFRQHGNNFILNDAGIGADLIATASALTKAG